MRELLTHFFFSLSLRFIHIRLQIEKTVAELQITKVERKWILDFNGVRAFAKASKQILLIFRVTEKWMEGNEITVNWSKKIIGTIFMFSAMFMNFMSTNDLPYSNWLFCRVPERCCAGEWAASWLFSSIPGFHRIFVYIHSAALAPTNCTLFIS